MAERRKSLPDDLLKRIGDAPRATREDLLGAVLGEKELKERTVLNGLLHGTAPPAAEWIDLADAGPYIDETEMPLFSPNGDGTGGRESYGDEFTAAWMDRSLQRIGAGSRVEAKDPAADPRVKDDTPPPSATGSDTELEEP